MAKWRQTLTYMLRVRCTYNTLLSWAFSVASEQFCKEVQVTCGSDGSVSIVTRLLDVRSRIRVPVLAQRPHRLWFPPRLLFIGYRDYFPGVERPGSDYPLTHCLVVSELRMSGVIPSLRPYAFMAWTGTSSPWHLLQNVPTDSGVPRPSEVAVRLLTSVPLCTTDDRIYIYAHAHATCCRMSRNVNKSEINYIRFL